MEHYHSYYIHGNLGKNTFNQSNPKTTTTNSRYGVNNSFVIGNSGQLSPALMDQCDTHLSSLTLNHNSHHHHHSPRTTKSSSSSNGNHPTKPSSSQTSTNNHQLLHHLHHHHHHQHTTVQLPPIDMSIEEQRALGYMPLRDDFEREFKNHAEVLLSTLSVANNQAGFISRPHNEVAAGEPNEDFVDYEMKLTLIKMYREVLIERQKMKKIAREYGLINNASALINNYNSSLTAATAGVGLNAGVCFTPSVKECTDGRRRKRGQNGNASRKDPR